MTFVLQLTLYCVTDVAFILSLIFFFFFFGGIRKMPCIPGVLHSTSVVFPVSLDPLLRFFSFLIRCPGYGGCPDRGQ